MVKEIVSIDKKDHSKVSSRNVQLNVFMVKDGEIKLVEIKV